MFQNRLPALIAVGLGLGALVWYDTARTVDPGGQPAPPVDVPQPSTEKKTVVPDVPNPNSDSEVSTPGAVPIPNPLASLDKSRLNATVERPLFAPSRRRPPEGVAELPPVDAGPPPSFDLLGVVQDAGRAIALLRDKGSGASLRAEIGDMIGGWQVSKVEPTWVILTRPDGTSQSVQLHRD